MVDRRGVAPEPPYDETITNVDWHGSEPEVPRFTRTRFLGVDLMETVTVGGFFSECTFRDVKFNASRHERSAFVNCTFEGCNFFDARFVDAKFTGSTFDACDFALLHVEGGDWSLAGFSGAKLQKATFTGVRMREADLSFARCSGATFADCDLSGSWFQGADLSRASLLGSDLSGMDPRTTEIEGAFIDERQAVALVETMGVHVIR